MNRTHRAACRVTTLTPSFRANAAEGGFPTTSWMGRASTTLQNRPSSGARPQMRVEGAACDGGIAPLSTDPPWHRYGDCAWPCCESFGFDHTKYGLIVEKQAALDEVWLACVHVLFFA